MTSLRRVDGSRPHDYVLSNLVSRHETDGWNVVRTKGRYVPAFFGKEGKIVALVVEGAPYRIPDDLNDFAGVLRERIAFAEDFTERHSRFARVVSATCRAQSREGWKSVNVTTLGENGYARIKIPDAVALKRGRLIALEVICKGSGTLSKKFRDYHDFDDVVIDKFDGARPFMPERPPIVRTIRMSDRRS